MAITTQRTYKITNWAKYNESLVQRGSITYWFDEDVVDAWNHANDEAKVGRPFVYSDVAIECLDVSGAPPPLDRARPSPWRPTAPNMGSVSTT